MPCEHFLPCSDHEWNRVSVRMLTYRRLNAGHGNNWLTSRARFSCGEISRYHVLVFLLSAHHAVLCVFMSVNDE